MTTDERPGGQSIEFDRRTALKGLGAAGLAAVLGSAASGTAAAGNGADKIYVGGSTREEYRLDSKTDGTASEAFTLLEGSVKTSTPTDLYLLTQLECALWTDVKVKGNDESSAAKAGVTCWIEIDGIPVPVSSDYPNEWAPTRQDASEVVFNYRDFRVESSFLGDIEDITDDEEYLALYQRTRSAHGFNWVALDLGSGEYDDSTNVHTVALKGRLETYVDDSKARAKAVIGPRTMVGVPAKLANDATL